MYTLLHHMRPSQRGLSSPLAGFTLIEVLMAMALLSFGLLSIAGMQLVAIQVNSFSHRLGRGTALVQDQVEQLMALPFNHADLEDTTPVDTYQTHTATSLPPGQSLEWQVDNNADNTSKTVVITGKWHASRSPIVFVFTKTVFQ
jgi:prepilin-type N-terminal cleavage/methylation domain-containing protein